MNIIKLYGVDEETEGIINDNIKNPDTIFVYMGEEKLYRYIDQLGKVITSSNFCRIKICKEIKPINVTLVRGDIKSDFSELSDLLAAIDAGMYQEVVIKGDVDADEGKVKEVRTQLSDIVQQLIYLNISLDEVQVMTEKEYKDNAMVRQFLQKIKEHEKNLNESKQMLSEKTFSAYQEIADEVKESLERIKEYLEDAQDNELKIAAAASKKSGKSVIVNSMLKCELAPTSLELATPNNCIYRKSNRGYYTLEYDGKQSQFSSEKEVRERIYEIFKKAEMDKEHKFTVPDMNIGYISSDEGFSAYTIYDTPGPDLAGADGHKEAAYKAINEVDVIIFAIDYSKYLTDSEVEYLKKIRDSFSEKKKFYSLILDVNKLDCRYGSEGDKSSIRILDFIRNKLRSIDPEFRDTIVIGTSALTYFNCIEMEKIPECADLGKNNSFRDDLEDLIEDFSNNRGKHNEVNAMQFIDNMIGNIRTFDGIRVKKIDEIKRHSGMPDLLSYVEYIARNKARVEKVNNLIYKIESEYAKIQNLFSFQQLEESLAENQELLDQAKKVLEDFSKEVNEIYSEKNYDFCKMCERGGFKSQSLTHEGSRSPFEFDRIREFCQKEFIDYAFDENKIIMEVVRLDIRNNFRSKIQALFRDIEHTLERKVIIKDEDGSSEAEIINVVEEEKVKVALQNACSGVNGQTRQNIENRIKESKSEMKNESEAILEDLLKIINERRQHLEKAVKKCREGLRKECGIDFNLILPRLEYFFRNDSIWKGGEDICIDTKALEMRLESDIDKEVADKGKVHNNWLFNTIGKVIGFEYNKLSYDEKYVMEYYDGKVAPEIEKFLRQADIADSYKEEKEACISELKDYMKYIQDEMKEQSEKAVSYAQGIENMIDQSSEEYEDNIEEIKKKQKTLEIIQGCVKKFCDEWGEKDSSWQLLAGGRDGGKNF